MKMETPINRFYLRGLRFSDFLFLLLLLLRTNTIYGHKPNIILILTDDQDITMNSMQAMPKLQSLIADRGATFVNAFVATPLCCPSRSSTLTGRYVHNHGVRNNSISGGCSDIKWQNGPEKVAFPTFLNDAGYNTFYSGKYLNDYGYDSVGGLTHIPPGWDNWAVLQGNSVYYNYTLSVNGEAEIHGDDPATDYLTNVVKNKSLNFINQLTGEEPFFMMIATPACHEPYTPEPKYEDSFSLQQIPRTPYFNIENGLDKHWLVRLGEQPLTDNVIEYIDDIYRNRLRTLLSVDDLVEEVINSLAEKNLLNRTYIFYSSDHGFHLGQFSLPFGKREPYEFDIRVPFMVRGPGIEAGVIQTEVITNIDLAPTFLELAGISITENMDGISIQNILMYSNLNSTELPHERSILVEHDGEGQDDLQPGCEYLGTGVGFCEIEVDCKCSDSFNNTYSCIRRLGINKNEMYCKWEDDEQFEEYYNIANDTYELTNTVLNLTTEYLNDLSKALHILMTCSGSECDIP